MGRPGRDSQTRLVAPSSSSSPFLNDSTLGQRAVLLGQTMHPTSLLSSHSLLALEALAIPLCCARRAFFIVCEPFI